MTLGVRVLVFGGCQFTPATGELARPGTRTRLRPQAGAVLTYLAERPGAVVNRVELRTLLWGDGVHVNFDRGLNSCMRQIRRALGDNPRRPSYIETLPRRGYRFVAKPAVSGARTEFTSLSRKDRQTRRSTFDHRRKFPRVDEHGPS